MKRKSHDGFYALGLKYSKDLILAYLSKLMSSHWCPGSLPFTHNDLLLVSFFFFFNSTKILFNILGYSIMEKNIKKNIYSVKLRHFAIQQSLAQH